MQQQKFFKVTVFTREIVVTTEVLPSGVKKKERKIWAKKSLSVSLFLYKPSR